MKPMKFSGHVVVNGVTVPVTLHVDVAGLINTLGERAARSRGRRAQMGHGAIVVTTGEDESNRVREIDAAKRAEWQRKRKRDVRHAAWLATRSG